MPELISQAYRLYIEYSVQAKNCVVDSNSFPKTKFTRQQWLYGLAQNPL